MANGDENTAEFKTGLFGLKLGGRDAISMFLFIALVAIAALAFWEHGLRNKEHKEITCMIRLNLFIYTLPRGEVLDWSRMPVDLYQCVPRFLFENQRPIR